MKQDHRLHNLLRVGLGLWIALLTLTDCSRAPAPAPATPASPTRAVTPAADATAISTPLATSQSALLTLSWWTPEIFSPQAAQDAGTALTSAVNAFEAAQSNGVRVQASLKARYGQGGLLDFLKTAHPVAPSLLPDVVVLDLAELDAAAAAGLVQPLESLLDEGVVARLYPFAQEAGVSAEHLVAVPFAADIEHLVYQANRVPEPPDTWAALLKKDANYLFPAGNPQAGAAGGPNYALQRAILSQYASTQGIDEPPADRFTPQSERLLRLFTFYQLGMSSRAFQPTVAEVTDGDAAWAAFAQGRAPLAYVSARRYLAERDTLKATGFAPAPGWAEPASPIATGWALAIVTPDPQRQRLAAAFITHLLRPENAGPWLRATGWLPTSSDTLAAWGANPYFEFLDEQLQRTLAYPPGAAYAPTAARLQKAAISTLKGETSPPEAAQAVLAAK